METIYKTSLMMGCPPIGFSDSYDAGIVIIIVKDTNENPCCVQNVKLSPSEKTNENSCSNFLFFMIRRFSIIKQPSTRLRTLWIRWVGRCMMLLLRETWNADKWIGE
jgi:hypothetical protein